MNSTATPPLVSIVVRTMGRATLPAALAAIARQTWRPLEIVLVGAGARGIATPAAGDVPVRVVTGGLLDRPRAANAGLANARGAWIGFLDEDDSIAPDHVALLMATATIAGLPVAYSQTLMLGADGRERIFGGPFDRAALVRSNYLAIHAVLFSRVFVDQGVRFDEALPMFEDWDFWLQLSEQTDFAFAQRPTAVYRATAGASGAGTGPNLDHAAVLAHRARLMRKWQAG